MSLSEACGSGWTAPIHPDDAGAEARFKAIAAAYEVLKDPETRARFDAGEIDGLGAERPQRQYYRDFAHASDNAYQQGHGFGANADPAESKAQVMSATKGDVAPGSWGAPAPSSLPPAGTES